MERILNPLGWNLLFATTLALTAWLLGSIPTLRRRPAFLYALWLLVLAKLIVPPFIGLPLLAPLPVPTVERHFIPPPTIVAMPIEQLPAAIPVPAGPPSFHWTEYFYEPRFWLFSLTLASLLITAILWCKTFLQTRRWGKLLHTTLPTPIRLQNLARTAASSLRIQGIPEIRLVDAQLTPFLWTNPGKITRAKNISIVLPRELTEKLTDDQLLCILMHELGHYARRDHWAHAFAGFVTSLFWWNPVSWWAWRELRALQEICCDTLVLKYSPDSRRLYAETLYAVLESLQTRTSAQPALSCSFGDSRHLRRRFSMLADTTIQPRLSPFALLTLLALTPLLPCLPTRAEPPAPEPKPASSASPSKVQQEAFEITLKYFSRVDDRRTPLELSAPRITVFPGQEATISMQDPPVTLDPQPESKESPSGSTLTFTMIPRPTPDGKVRLAVHCQAESQDTKSRMSWTLRDSPFTLEYGRPEKVVIHGSSDNLLNWAEITVAKSQPPSSITQAAAVAPQPTPQMHVQSHKLPERFWIRPGEPLSNMRSPKHVEFKPIIDHITANFAPDSWTHRAGYGQYELLLLDRSLVVFSIPEVHAQIATYLNTLRPEPPNQKGKYTLSLGLSLTGPGLFGSTPLNLGHSTVVAHNLVTPTGQDPLGRPIATRDDYEKFIASLKEIEPKSWDTNGGQGKIEYSLLTGTIHFQNTSEVSSQIHNHCAELLQKNLAESPLKPGPLPPQPQPIQPVSNEVPDSNSNKPEPPPVPATPTSDNPQTKVDSQNPLYVVLYNVDKLFDLPKDRDLKQEPLAPADLQPLVDEMTKSIAPDSWKSKGGQGMIVSNISPEHDHRLIIRQTDEIHEQIEKFLEDKRRQKTNQNKPANPDKEQSKSEINDQAILGETFLVSDLIEIHKNRNLTTHPLAVKDIEPLAEDIRRNVAPLTWNNPAGKPRIIPQVTESDRKRVPLVLEVHQTSPVLAQIHEYLAKKRHKKIKQISPALIQNTDVSKEGPGLGKPLYQTRNASFYVMDLVGLEPFELGANYDFKPVEALKAEVISKIHPDNWNENGGPGHLVISPWVPSTTGKVCLMLLVYDSPETIVHEIKEFLEEKRRQKTNPKQTR